MEKEFVPYKQALKLKELGFDESCFCFYQLEYSEIRPIMVDDDEQYRLTGYRTCKNSEIPKHYTSAPTFSQAFIWFREKYDFIGTVLGDGFNGKLKGYYYSITEEGWINYYESIDDIKWYDTYEEAELACLNKLIEIVKTKSK